MNSSFAVEQKLTKKTFPCKKSIHMINDMEVGYERKHYQNPVQIRTMLGDVVLIYRENKTIATRRILCLIVLPSRVCDRH